MSILKRNSFVGPCVTSEALETVLQLFIPFNCLFYDFINICDGWPSSIELKISRAWRRRHTSLHILLPPCLESV